MSAIVTNKKQWLFYVNCNATGIQTDPITCQIIYNNENKYDKICPNCIANNKIPKLFFYYNKLCTKITLNFQFEYYNMCCNEGHTFVNNHCFRL